MRLLIKEVSAYARSKKSNFIIIPQNAPQIFMLNDCENGTTGKIDSELIESIDGWAMTNFLYGLIGDNQLTPNDFTKVNMEYLKRIKSSGKEILVTDYCWSFNAVLRSYFENSKYGFVSVATYRALASIPSIPRYPFNENSKNVTKLSDVKNWLYLLNPEYFASKFDFLFKINITNYDMFVLSPFYDDNIILTAKELNSLKNKNIGGSRLVICYMSIGEASNYLPYWKNEWYKVYEIN